MIHNTSHHIQFKDVKVDSLSGDITNTDIYPTNTSDDVIINEDGKKLSDYIPYATSSPTSTKITGQILIVSDDASYEFASTNLENKILA